MRKEIKGSFTVEAALLTPVFLMVIMIAIHMQLYMFEKAWEEASAWEEKVTIATEEEIPAVDYIQKIRVAKKALGRD